MFYYEIGTDDTGRGCDYRQSFHMRDYKQRDYRQGSTVLMKKCLADRRKATCLLKNKSASEPENGLV